MPFVGGDNLIHVTKLDYIVPTDEPLVEIPTAKIGPLEQRIGEICAELINDGDTLQIGIGAIPDAVLQCLGDRRDLGLHTEMFTDGVMHMIRSGNITGARKTLHPYKVASSIIMGSRELYDFIDGNEMIEMYPVDHMNDPYVVGQNDNMVSINSCLEIDLYGQVASEAIGLDQFSGTGGTGGLPTWSEALEERTLDPRLHLYGQGRDEISHRPHTLGRGYHHYRAQRCRLCRYRVWSCAPEGSHTT